MSVKTKAVISIVLNTLMTIITIGIVISYFFTKNFLIKTNQDIFTYFTTDSNLLACMACIAAIVMVVFDIQILRGKRTIIPKPAIIFKFVSVVAVMVVLVTCLVYLAPRYGFDFIFGKTFFHMHMGAPVMAFRSAVGACSRPALRGSLLHHGKCHRRSKRRLARLVSFQ